MEITLGIKEGTAVGHRLAAPGVFKGLRCCCVCAGLLPKNYVLVCNERMYALKFKYSIGLCNTHIYI